MNYSYRYFAYVRIECIDLAGLILTDVNKDTKFIRRFNAIKKNYCGEF